MTGVLPLANVTHGTSNQFLITNSGGTASTWATMSGGCTQTGGVLTCSTGATSLTGDVVGTISGSAIPTTVDSLTGSAGTVSIGASSMTWNAGAGSGGNVILGQTTQASNIATHNLELAPQPAFASATGSNGTPGSLVVALGAPVSSGSEANLSIQRAGGATTTIGAFPGSPSTARMTMAGADVVDSDGTNVRLGLGVTTGITFAPSSETWGVLTRTTAPRGWELGYNVAAPGLVDFGGGDDVVGIPAAIVVPTTAPTKGNVVLYGNGTTGNLGIDASGLELLALSAAPTAQVGGDAASIYAAFGYLGINANGIQFPSFAGSGGVIEIAANAPSTGNGNNIVIIAAAAGLGGVAGGVTINAGDSHASIGVGPGGTAGVTSTSSITIDAQSSSATAITIGQTTTGAITIGNATTPAGQTLTLGPPLLQQSLLFDSSESGPNFGQSAIVGAGNGGEVFYSGQPGGTSGTNAGGEAILIGGAPHGGGTVGAAAISTSDGQTNVTALVSGSTPEIQLTAGGTLAVSVASTVAAFAVPVSLTGGVDGTAVTTIGISGSASALPALPVGYLHMKVNGTTYAIPYYNP